MPKIEPMLKADQRSSFLVLSVAILAYCATPWFGFVFDDRKQVLANSTLLHPGSIPGYFLHAGGYLSGDFSYYRPLFGTWMNLNYFLFGLHAPGWHLALLLLHALAAFLCYRLLRAILQDEGMATLGALLFAVHPVHVESVAWVSGSTDPLAAVFILLAFLFYLGARENGLLNVLSWLAFAASLLCKETALLFPFVMLSNGLLMGEETGNKARRALARAIPYFVVAGLYLVARIHVLGAFSHTLAPLPLKVLLFTLPSVAIFYVRQLIVPSGLSPFYDTPYVRTASLTGFGLPVLLLLAIGALLAMWIRSLRKTVTAETKTSRQIAFFIVWTLFFLVPAFNLSALDPGEIAHDRYLYLPSIGFCAVLAIVLKQLAARLKLSAGVRRLAAAGIGIVFCAATIAQSLYWKDDLSLYKRGAAMAPNNINAQNNLANIYLETGDYARGIAAHERILQLNPSFVDSYFNLGLAYYNQGDFVRAQFYLREAIARQPAPASYFYLGLAQFKKGDLLAAEQSLRAANQLDPRRPDFHAALGVLYETEEKLPLALQELEQALALNPQNSNIQKEVAKIKRQLGQP
jgi:tetratricopeptide (TPR) repeat protein